MKKQTIILLSAFIWLLLANSAQAMFKDDPWLTKVMSEFEYLQEDGEDVVEWDIDAWTGRDLSKFWVKSSGEYADSEFEDANIEFVYSRAVSAYWDQQFGVRHDFKPDPDKVREIIEDRSKNYKDPDQVINYFYSDDEQLRNVESISLEEQVVDALKMEAKATEENLTYEDCVSGTYG